MNKGFTLAEVLGVGCAVTALILLIICLCIWGGVSAYRHSHTPAPVVAPVVVHHYGNPAVHVYHSGSVNSVPVQRTTYVYRNRKSVKPVVVVNKSKRVLSYSRPLPVKVVSRPATPVKPVVSVPRPVAMPARVIPSAVSVNVSNGVVTHVNGVPTNNVVKPAVVAPAPVRTPAPTPVYVAPRPTYTPPPAPVRSYSPSPSSSSSSFRSSSPSSSFGRR